jgi:hypothetical protein
MHALPSLLRALAVMLVLTPPAMACAAEAEDPARVGFVNKAENEAEIVALSGATAAAVGTPVHMRDELLTGANGRLQVTFRDNTVLTLGENASVLIDRYVFDPEKGIGEAVLQATKGAFRFATGRMKELSDKKIAISTPVADIGVRGTEFWGGPLDAKYGVLLLDGEVSVSNQAGSVTLSTPGQGTDIPSPLDPPGAPSVWPAAKVARAIATVALH